MFAFSAISGVRSQIANGPRTAPSRVPAISSASWVHFLRNRSGTRNITAILSRGPLHGLLCPLLTPAPRSGPLAVPSVPKSERGAGLPG
jgi:hypothetical protein